MLLLYILAIGDCLPPQEYAVARNLCYQWYLDYCVPVNPEGSDIKERYFSDGFKGYSAVLTVRLELH